MKKIILVLLVLLVLTSFVSAFGVSSPYWKGNPLKMAKGETRIVNLNLQNNVGDEDVTVKAEIEEGHEIVSLSKDIYTVKARTYDMMVPVEIKIPEDAKEEYRVILNFKTVSAGEEGKVSFGTAMQVGFMVIPTEKPAIAETETPAEKPSYSSWGVFLGIIILIIIIILVILMLRRSKKKSQQGKGAR
jgi:ATP-dependent Zn protease